MRDESSLVTAEGLSHPPRHIPGEFSPGRGIEEGRADGREVFGLFVEFLYRERPILLKELMDRIEKDIIIRSLRMADGNQKQAAGILGVKYTTLHEKLKKHGIRFRRAPVPLAF